MTPFSNLVFGSVHLPHRICDGTVTLLRPTTIYPTMSSSTLAESHPRHELGPPDSANESFSTFVQEKSKVPGGEEPPDGGYGWVIVGCCFFLYAVTWGTNATFGVFLSFYRKNNYFPNATDTDFAFIGGLSISMAMLVAPPANYLSKTFNFRVPMIAGAIIYVLAQVFAGLSKTIWQLFLTQGVMFGMGLGALFVPSLPLINQWFTRRRAWATGIAAAGSGAGGLVLSLTTRVIIQRLGLKWAFFINAFISLAALIPILILLKSRDKIINAKFEPIQYKLIWHPGFFFVWLWGFFSIFGYVFALYTIATYSTSGLGLSQAKGASLQSILAAGQMIGRPLCGLVMDRFGRINLASFLTFASGLSCLAVWLVARSYGVLIFFAIFQGMVGGVFWGSSGPVTVEIVGLSELGSALSILWLSLVIPATLSEPVAAWLLEYSQNHLHRTGADAFLISIGVAGASFMAASLILLGAKRWKQGNWAVFTKT